MKKEKFIYNKHTLSYEKVEQTWQQRIFLWFGYACAVLVTATIFHFTSQSFFPSPNEQILMRELNQMTNQIEVVNEQLTLYEKVLGNLQDRDANVHRAMFGMDPIDNGIWEGGVGGSEKYNHLKAFKNSGKIMTQTMKRLDKLGRQMSLQSKSLDSIVVLIKEKDKMLASIPSIKPVRKDRLNKAMSQMSGFGVRIHPIFKVAKMHQGIDFAARTGTPIYATGDGQVVRAKSSSGFGKNVVLDHGYGYKSLYGHMSKILVKPGQKVKKGEKIGLVGSTGRSTAPHLHYEIHYKGKPINPIDYCRDNLTPQEYKQLVELATKSNISFD